MPFWPECILAVRSDDGLEDEQKVSMSFTPDIGSNGHFGKLAVTYTKGLTTNINGKEEPWRRAFSQVDCQHRLGTMAQSSESVTFCVLPEITRRQEAILFRAINQNQKGIPTSLVDTIIYVTDPNVPIHISWAWELLVDGASPFYNIVDTGGRGQDKTLITFRGLQQSLKLLVPPRRIDTGGISGGQGYYFARDFWTTVHDEWPTEFENKDDFKMMVNPGVRALSRLGRGFLVSKLDTQDFRMEKIRDYLQAGKHQVDWSNNGPLRDATGKGAEKRVFEQLNSWFGKPD